MTFQNEPFRCKAPLNISKANPTINNIAENTSKTLLLKLREVETETGLDPIRGRARIFGELRVVEQIWASQISRCEVSGTQNGMNFDVGDTKCFYLARV